MSRTTQMHTQRPNGQEGPGFYWVREVYSIMPNKANFTYFCPENGGLPKKQSQSGRPERDCGLGPFDYAQDGFADFRSHIQSGGQGPDRQRVAPNKANFRPFWAGNRGRAEKQSQFAGMSENRVATLGCAPRRRLCHPSAGRGPSPYRSRLDSRPGRAEGRLCAGMTNAKVEFVLFGGLGAVCSEALDMVTGCRMELYGDCGR